MPAITPISTVPPFASPEEHNAIIGSTPASFTDIPSILRHREDNVLLKLNPPLSGFAEGSGTLYVLTSVLAFMSIDGQSGGFQIEYPSITLHAISRGEKGPSIYCQLEGTIETAAPMNGTSNEGDDDDDDNNNNEDDEDADDTPLQELSIFPQAAESLEPIFEALSQCAALHPDPHDGEDDDDDGDDDTFIDASAANFEVFNGNENQELSEVGRAALEYMESIIQDPQHLMAQFDDAQGDDDGAEVPPDSESEPDEGQEDEADEGEEGAFQSKEKNIGQR